MHCRNLRETPPSPSFIDFKPFLQEKGVVGCTKNIYCVTVMCNDCKFIFTFPPKNAHKLLNGIATFASIA